MAELTLGQIIKKFRKSKGLSGKEFSALWGGGPSTVTDIEKDRKKPGYEILCALKRSGMSIDLLIEEAEGIPKSHNTVTSVCEEGNSYKLGVNTKIMKQVNRRESDLIERWRHLTSSEQDSIETILRMKKGDD